MILSRSTLGIRKLSIMVLSMATLSIMVNGIKAHRITIMLMVFMLFYAECCLC
jgi:hypothetical protein